LDFFAGWVELYQVHNLVAVEKRLDMLEELKDEGKVRSIGATHYSRSAFPALMEVMRGGRVDFVQVPYNTADVTVAQEVLPLAQERGLGVIAMVPLVAAASSATPRPRRTSNPCAGSASRPGDRRSSSSSSPTSA
jgi:aryl-alcohol dehydrogenase-like predicted oxidoreductase